MLLSSFTDKKVERETSKLHVSLGPQKLDKIYEIYQGIFL
jgi:hypothetical protein